MIARTMGTRGEMTSRITGMVRIRWLLLNRNNRVVVTARDPRMTALHEARIKITGGKGLTRTGPGMIIPGTHMRRCWMDLVVIIR